MSHCLDTIALSGDSAIIPTSKLTVGGFYGLKIGLRMSSACLLQVLDKSAVADAAQAYLRAFQKQLRVNPSNFQRSLMDLAAITAARFDAASRNPDVTAQDLSHLERVARRAKRDMLESRSLKRRRLPSMKQSKSWLMAKAA